MGEQLTRNLEHLKQLTNVMLQKNEKLTELQEKLHKTQSSTNEVVSDSLVLIAGVLPEIGSLHNDGAFTPPVKVVEPIKNISVAALKSRLLVQERYAIRSLTDIYSLDIYDDLGSRLYADVDDPVLIQGLSYLLNLLTTVPDYFDNNVMTVTDLQGRLDTLLADGTEAERYNGPL